MIRKVEDFIQSWKYETASTLKLYKQITNEVLSNQVNENCRNILQLARHINHTVTELPNTATLPIEINHATLNTIEDLMQHYEADANKLAQVVSANWTDESLNDEVNMYGEKWKKGVALHILITHQAHHRGQLTILMRLAGLKVPGVYGPAKEEWAQMGLTPQE